MGSLKERIKFLFNKEIKNTRRKYMELLSLKNNEILKGINKNNITTIVVCRRRLHGAGFIGNHVFVELRYNNAIRDSFSYSNQNTVLEHDRDSAYQEYPAIMCFDDVNSDGGDFNMNRLFQCWARAKENCCTNVGYENYNFLFRNCGQVAAGFIQEIDVNVQRDRYLAGACINNAVDAAQWSRDSNLM